MKIQRFTFNFFGENTYVVWDEASGEAAVIDPGMINAREEAEIDGFIEQNGLKVKHLVNTHLHIDHVFGNRHMAERYGLKTEAHPDDASLGRGVGNQASMFGIRNNPGSVTIDVPLHAGDKIALGDEELEVVHIPGHSPGGIALYSPKDAFMITGDSIFQESIGRTDLPGGNYGQLIRALQKHVLTLPPATVLYPGHGDATTVNHELHANPFL